ncbi:FecCD family ABC transporter permease [Streptomyces profundus]|uniref:FecCD family ABC transporter permease n=1 Tax=Streptomyces profundus TaxID=2867410 RepID=UPI001D1664E8|nr:iron chelate uptake ABC transporter family permease subunit [Streptomyces sp. MA3_2.13]UED86753.1 iron chelate uptake ABC transporter family permease subunit [Streptomyces sp. MA3_2.13]
MTGQLVLRHGRFSTRVARRPALVCLALGALTVALAALALTLGRAQVTLPDIVAVLSGQERGMPRKVVLEWRLPRIVAAVVFGAALGVSGAVFQSLTRNPLGSPDIIGFNSGAYTGVVVAILLGATGYAALAAGALLGGVATAALVYTLAFRNGLAGFRFVIVGIAVGAFLSSLNTWFSVRAEVDLALRAAVWGAGSLARADWTALALAGAGGLVVLACLPLAQRWLRHLELGDATAAGIGVPVERAKGALVLLGVVTTALVTASAGPISFVALAAPHIARRLTGRGESVDLLGSALVGALLLLASDVAAQHAVPGVVLPVGAVTVCFGGLYLVWLLVVESRRS